MSFDNLFGLAPLEAETETSTENTTETSTTETQSVEAPSTPDASVSKQPVKTEFPKPTPRQEPAQQAPQQELVFGMSPEEFQAFNNQWNDYFDFDPIKAVNIALDKDIPLSLSQEQQQFLNDRYLEWFDKDPVAAQAWAAKLALKEHDVEREKQTQKAQEDIELKQQIATDVKAAVEDIVTAEPVFKEPLFDNLLFRLSNALAEEDDENKYTNAGDYFKEAAGMIKEAIDHIEKRGYEKAKAELTKKKMTYVEGSGNVIPARSSKDDKAEALANKDVDTALGIALRNLKRT